VSATFPDLDAPAAKRAAAEAEKPDLATIGPEEPTDDPPDDFLAQVEPVCRLHAADASAIERIDDGPLPYLRITEKLRGGSSIHALGAQEGSFDPEMFDRFLTIHRRYRQHDATIRSLYVLDGTPTEDDRRSAAAHGVTLVGFDEYRRFIDFTGYLARQTRRLFRSQIYPPRLYVAQRARILIDAGEQEVDYALTAVRAMLDEPGGRFIVILGDVGTGKTFLLRELARRMGTDGSPTIPLLIDMRDLEKGRTLDELISRHLVRSGLERIDLKAFRYMLAGGHIALLFDGFDELALRVTFPRAVTHLRTLLEAAEGQAKVVMTGRTRQFRSFRLVRTALGRMVERLSGERTVHLQPFDPDQVRRFLTNRFGDAEAAEARFRLINTIRNLSDLSANPRMLNFIVDVPELVLRQARDRGGDITAPRLYGILLERWTDIEIKRSVAMGEMPVLTATDIRDAVTDLALFLWRRTEPAANPSELKGRIGRILERLTDPRLAPDEAGRRNGSGALILRRDDGSFSFVHQSVLEWLVTRQAARDLDREGTPIPGDKPVSPFGDKPISPLMADIFADLVGRGRAIEWASKTLGAPGGEWSKGNALLVLRRLQADPGIACNLAGQDLRGRDLSGQELAGAEFSHADLTGAVLVATNLNQATLMGARLVGADLSDADLSDAVLEGADLSRADLLGADLRGARLSRATLYRARLPGPPAEGGMPADTHHFGAAYPQLTGLRPVLNFAARLNAVAWSPDGRLMATGGTGGVLLWDAETGEPVTRLSGHCGDVTVVAFSADGSRLATASDDRTATLWDVATGHLVFSLQGHQGAVTGVAFSPDGTRLVTASEDRTAALWDVATGWHLNTLPAQDSALTSVAFNPDGARIALGSGDHTASLWEVGSGRRLASFEGHQGAVTAVAFSPDGALLATASEDQGANLWDVASGWHLTSFRGHQGTVTDVAFSSDGVVLATASVDGSAGLWDVVSGHHRAFFRGHRGGLTGVAFHPDGSELATVSGDRATGLWDVATSRRRAFLRGQRIGITGIAFSPDGSALAAGCDDRTVTLWDTVSGHRRLSLQGHRSGVTGVAFSPDGSLLASGSEDGTAGLWDLASGQNLGLLRGHLGAVRCVAFRPVGGLLATGSDDRTAALWEIGTGQRRATLQGHQGRVNAVAFSADGTLLASCGRDGAAMLWEVTTGQRRTIIQGHQLPITGLAFSPDGTVFATGSDDRTATLWDIASGRSRTSLHGHLAGITGVAFSPDGNLIATASRDRTARLWDGGFGRHLATFHGHQDSVTSVTFSPDGAILATGSADNTGRLWHVWTGKCLAILANTPEGWAAFTPDGRYRFGGIIKGNFWFAINLCRFEPAELDRHLPAPLILADDAPILPSAPA
jgi:WD40 repeat protein/type II secretory pathway predicted ATPase ExeA